MSKQKIVFSTGMVSLTLGLFALLLLLTACDADDFSPTSTSTSLPETAVGEKATPVPEIGGSIAAPVNSGFDCAGVTEIPTEECAALVALYNRVNGPGWVDSSGWLSTDTPCSWTGISCTGGHVSDISLSYNQLTGSLPPELGSLTHLRALQLGSNQLSGPIPAELGNLSELVSLHLWDNQLTGPLPEELWNLDKLQSLTLAGNQISGSIPAELGELVSLQSLDLSHNQFSGALPPELGELTNLYTLDLSHNQLSGALPAAFDRMSKLDEINLSYNQLSGTIPESMSKVARKMLWGNQLEGTILSDGQDPFTVDYGGVHFTADPSLATSIWPEVKPATPLPDDLDGPSYWLALPEHIRFTFANPDLSPERQRLGFNLETEGQVLVFPLAKLSEINPSAQAQVELLRNLLEERATEPDGELPLLPLTNSAQVFHTQENYLDSDKIHGLRYISQHSQDPHPIMLNSEIFYTFQGITDDGAHYVAAFYPLSTDALPDSIEIEDWDAFHANYDAYLQETTALLDQLGTAEFYPDLTLLDAVAASIRTEQESSAADSPGDESPIVVEQVSALPSLDLKLDPAAGLVAYQQDNQLWLNDADLSADSQSIAECVPEERVICAVPPVKWAPDGSRFFYEVNDADGYKLIISDLHGQRQGYRISPPPSRSPVWSPDGSKIVLFVLDTTRPWGDHTSRDFSPLDLGFTDEVWQLQMDSSGRWLAPQKLADLETAGIGCGGGGGSTSDALYDFQGGFALGYLAARQMAWTSDGVIIYPLTCDYWQGYGRLDAETGQPLEPYSGLLRGLVLDSSGSRWYAVTGINQIDDPANNRLVTGTSSSTDYEVLETAAPVDMVFVGLQSGRLYYTTRERIDHKDLSEQIQWNKSVEPYFNFYHTQLWTILPNGTGERLLWESTDHSYSRVTEKASGDIIFVVIENDEPLYEAVAGGALEEEWIDYLPQTHIMRLTPDGGEPEIWLEDAHSLNAWYP